MFHGLSILTKKVSMLRIIDPFGGETIGDRVPPKNVIDVEGVSML